jgi:hypothetical protein
MKFDIDDVPDPPRSRDFYTTLSDDQRQFIKDAWRAYTTGQYNGSIINLARFVKEKADIPIGANYLKDWMSANEELLTK